MAIQPAVARADSNLGLGNLGFLAAPLAHLSATDTALHQWIRKATMALPKKDFRAHTAVSDAFSTTLKYRQFLGGIEVLGREAHVTFGPAGELSDVAAEALAGPASLSPRLSTEEARKLLSDRYRIDVGFTEEPTLRVFQDETGVNRLIYLVRTAASGKHPGRVAHVDAQTGRVLLEYPRERAAFLGKFKGNVYSAATEAALEAISIYGIPTEINTSRYKQVFADGKALYGYDDSAVRADRNARWIQEYFFKRFGYASYDGKNSPLHSVVHAGFMMNNAYWSESKNMIIYGDGDNEHYKDFTLATDIAAHEFTHGIVGQTARFVYSGQSGALDESYADFFGKMVTFDARAKDQTERWNFGAAVAGPKLGRKVARNLLRPELYDQPERTTSPKFVRDTIDCGPDNDECGVHINSGVPNRAAALIVEAIGREKTEALYFNVLTQRLQPSSNFHEARVQTEKACALAFGGASTECKQVALAFDAVHIM